MRHLEASQTPFITVLACFEDRSGCSCVSSEGLHEIVCEESAFGNGARNSFAVSFIGKFFRFSVLVFCVLLKFRRPAWQSVTDRQP